MSQATNEEITKMTLNIPKSVHRSIKAKAALRGQTMRDFVLERLATDDEEYDLDDINVAIAQGLKEVGLYQQGKIKLQSAREVLEELKSK